MAARIVGLLLLGACFLPSLALAQQLVVEQGPPADALTVDEIRQKLSTTDIELDLVETPLRDAAVYLEQMLDLPIHIDQPTLKDVGLTIDVPVSLQLKTKARTVLCLMLKELDLAYLIEPGRIVITTPEEAESQLRTVFYPVGDLVMPPGIQPGSGFWPDFDSLTELITTTVQPEMWEVLGGPGPISAYRDGIIISQTDEVHDRVEHLLQALREVRSLKADDSRDARHASPTAQAEAELQRKMTEARVTLTLEETPLTDLLQMLGDQLEISVHIDRRALEDIGETSDLALTGRWNQMSPATVLKDVLHAHGLTWIAGGEVLVITTYEEAESELITKVYPVGDLEPELNESTLLAPRYAYSYSSADGWLYENLIYALTSQVELESWESLGGPGSIAPYELANALVVSQTHEVHQNLNELLRQIRAKSVPLEDGPPADGDEAKTDGAASEPLTITYLAHSVEGKPQSTPEDLFKVAGRMMRVIAPESWQDKAHYVEVLSDRLIICQRRDVHFAIEQYLRQAGIIHYPVIGGVGMNHASIPSSGSHCFPKGGPGGDEPTPSGVIGTGSRFIGDKMECIILKASP